MAFIRSALRGSSSSLHTPEKWLVDWANGGEESAAGVHVSHETAMHYAPFFAGVRLISEDVGRLPFPVYERLEGKGKRRATEHPLHGILNQVANPYMTGMQLRETLTGHAITWGGGYGYMERNGAGEIVEIWPLRPDRIWPEKLELGRGRIQVIWRYQPQDGPQSVLFPDEILHVPGFSYDGFCGYSAVTLARQSIGLGLATEAFGARWFSNGSRPGGVLEHPGEVSEAARKRMKADWDNIHRGVDRAHRIAILEEGVTWKQIGIPPEDAQFLETRRFQVTDMARWLRLPPHKLADLERSTHTNIEHQQLEYVNEALLSWLSRWEGAVLLRGFTANERKTLFAEHIVAGLLRGDIKSRYEAYAIARQWGWLSANDIAELENMNPLPGREGDIYLVPLNMVPAASLTAGSTDPGEPRQIARAIRGRSLEARRRIASAFAPLIADADERLAKLEQAEVRTLVRKHLDPERAAGQRLSVTGFLDALWRLYDGTVRTKTTERWTPVLKSLMVEVIADAISDVGFDGEVDLDRWLAAYVQSHVDYRCNSAFGQLRKVLDDAADPAKAVLDKLADWVELRPERTARWQTTQLPNAAARETYRAAGVRSLTWVSMGENSCPFCEAMDGQRVNIDEPFVAKGAELGGLAEKLQIDRDTYHPPLHPGCDCQVLPG